MHQGIGLRYSYSKRWIYTTTLQDLNDLKILARNQSYLQVSQFVSMQGTALTNSRNFLQLIRRPRFKILKANLWSLQVSNQFVMFLWLGTMKETTLSLIEIPSIQ